MTEAEKLAERIERHELWFPGMTDAERNLILAALLAYTSNPQTVTVALNAARVLRNHWLNDGHELRDPGLSEFRAAREAFDAAIAGVKS